MGRVEENGLKYLRNTVLSSLLGYGAGSLLSKALTEKEQEKLNSLTTLLKGRLERNPKDYQTYTNLVNRLNAIKDLPKGNVKIAEEKLRLLQELNEFVNSLSARDRQIYVEIQVLTDKIINISTSTKAAGFWLGGLMGLAIT